MSSFNTNSMQENFNAWLDKILKEDFSDDMVAVNFNLYEHRDDNWSMEFIGTSRFDEEDEDWACDAVVSSHERFFIVAVTSWEVILNDAIIFLNNYLDVGKYADKLKAYQAVGVGFVDGNISILFKR